MSEDRIEKRVEIKATVSRVWRALTDHREFGEWFKVAIDQPFVVGQESTGFMTHPGYEHLKWSVVVQAIKPQRLFSYTWHPYTVDPAIDYSAEEPTLVEFRLEAIAGGTLLTVTESGFEKIPAARRAEAFMRNEGGWAAQMRNIEAHVSRAA